MRGVTGSWARKRRSARGRWVNLTENGRCDSVGDSEWQGNVPTLRAMTPHRFVT